MKTFTRLCLPLLLVAVISTSCMSFLTRTAFEERSPIYKGVIRESVILGETWRESDPGWIMLATAACLIDLPLCLIADTLLLPYDIAIWWLHGDL